jgi:arabinan endo-1,5-alpha-L-arabinosidase
VEGTWELSGEYDVTITIDDHTYKGVFLEQWDEDGKKNVMTFTALCSESGTAIWGSGLNAIE